MPVYFILAGLGLMCYGVYKATRKETAKKQTPAPSRSDPPKKLPAQVPVEPAKVETPAPEPSKVVENAD